MVANESKQKLDRKTKFTENLQGIMKDHSLEGEESWIEAEKFIESLFSGKREEQPVIADVPETWCQGTQTGDSLIDALIEERGRDDIQPYKYFINTLKEESQTMFQ